MKIHSATEKAQNKGIRLVLQINLEEDEIDHLLTHHCDPLLVERLVRLGHSNSHIDVLDAMYCLVLQIESDPHRKKEDPRVTRQSNDAHKSLVELINQLKEARRQK